MNTSTAISPKEYQPVAGGAIGSQVDGAHLQSVSDTKAGKAVRILAIDFTKGSLVLFMVLYHWLNYFVSSQGEFYKYLRFLTPSFIFITGFLISSLHLSKYKIGGLHLAKRLAYRGLKIMVLFLGLNLAINLLISLSSGHGAMSSNSWSDLVSLFTKGSVSVAGAKSAAFYVLLPISYVLILAAGGVIFCKFYRYTFVVIWALLSLLIVFLHKTGIENSNLELVTMGFLGAALGYMPLDKINSTVKHGYLLVGSYLCYAIAITIWNAVYFLQMVGVCLTLLCIYSLGARSDNRGITGQAIVLLGKYSLFGYVAQIAILQVLHRILPHEQRDPGNLILSFSLAFILTMSAVLAVDRLRARSTGANRLYEVIFA